MANRKSIITLTFISTLLLGLTAKAQGSCVFYASESYNHIGRYSSSSIYGYGPVSFVWDPGTGRILGGYYPERVVVYTPVITYFNNIISGTITAGPVNSPLNLSVRMLFNRSVPDGYWFELNGATLTGTPGAATLSGMLDGPYLFEATGTVTCQ
jgi:hypothetical protein